MRFQSNISASAVQSGTFSGTYLITGSLQTGTTNPLITITGAGINAYNAIGTNTFILSSADGSITINGGTITGGIIQTALTGQRVRIDSALGNQILFYSGNVSETAAGFIRVGVSTGQGTIFITSPVINAQALSNIALYSADSTGTVPSQIVMASQSVNVTQDLIVFGNISGQTGISLPNTPPGRTVTTGSSGAIGAVSTTLATLTIVTGVLAGGLYLVAFTCLGLTGTVLADVFQFNLRNGGVGFAAQYAKTTSVTANSSGITFFGYVTLPANTTNSLTVTCIRVSGTGTLTVLAAVGLPYVLAANPVIG